MTRRRSWSRSSGATACARRCGRCAIPKTILQEWAQARGLPTPTYREVERTGPHHDPEFRVAVDLPSREPAEGLGRSKRAAEQAAAAAMLKREGVKTDRADG